MAETASAIGSTAWPLPPDDARSRWLPRVDRLDPRHPSNGDAVAAVWDGHVWGRLGRGDRAWACFATVTDPALAGWVAHERGRVLRELDLHAEARRTDAEGLAATRDIGDVVRLRVSLADDALVAARVARRPEEAGAALARAERELGAAAGLLAELPDGPSTSRQWLRARWASCRLALLRGQRVDATGLPWRDGTVAGFPPEHDDGTDHHRTVGLLLASQVRDELWLLRRAAELAPPALQWRVQLALADRDHDPARPRAVAAWDLVHPPPPYVAEAGATDAARRVEVLRAEERL